MRSRCNDETSLTRELKVSPTTRKEGNTHVAIDNIDNNDQIFCEAVRERKNGRKIVSIEQP